MSWVVWMSGVVGFWVGFGVCWSLMREKGHADDTDNKEKIRNLTGDEKRVYDLLVEADGVGYFAKSCEELGISKKKMEGVVESLAEKGLVRDKKFSYQRKLYLVGYLNRLERKVLEFLKKSGGKAEVAEIMKKVGTEDHKLIPMGKKFVRMGLIRKVRRGRGTFFVLVN